MRRLPWTISLMQSFHDSLRATLDCRDDVVIPVDLKSLLHAGFNDSLRATSTSVFVGFDCVLDAGPDKGYVRLPME